MDDSVTSTISVMKVADRSKVVDFWQAGASLNALRRRLSMARPRRGISQESKNLKLQYSLLDIFIIVYRSMCWDVVPSEASLCCRTSSS